MHRSGAARSGNDQGFSVDTHRGKVRLTKSGRQFQAGKAVSSLLDPVKGIRDAQKRRGITPRNHHADNMRALKEAQRQNRLYKIEEKQRKEARLTPWVNPRLKSSRDIQARATARVDTARGHVRGPRGGGQTAREYGSRRRKSSPKAAARSAIRRGSPRSLDRGSGGDSWIHSSYNGPKVHTFDATQSNGPGYQENVEPTSFNAESQAREAVLAREQAMRGYEQDNERYENSYLEADDSTNGYSEDYSVPRTNIADVYEPVEMDRLDGEMYSGNRGREIVPSLDVGNIGLSSGAWGTNNRRTGRDAPAAGGGRVRRNGGMNSSGRGRDVDSMSTTSHRQINYLRRNKANSSRISRHQDQQMTARRDRANEKSGRKNLPERQTKPGEIPKYLRDRHEQWETEREAAIASMPDPTCPPGKRRITEDEREKTLEMLRNDRKAARALMFQQLPCKIETLGQRRRQAVLQGNLDKAEQAIKVFEQPDVFVRIGQPLPWMNSS